MRYVLLCLVFSACSLFHDDESITIHKPEVGQEIDIKTIPVPKESK